MSRGLGDVYKRQMQGQDVKPETAGRLARVLGVDVTEIIETEE